MTTAQKVFDIALGLMDELTGSSGDPANIDMLEYRQRTLPILTALRGELYYFSDTLVPGETGRRPVCPEVVDFDAPVALDDFLAQSVLPYGLAAHLLLDENPAVASFFQQRYQELIARFASAAPAVSEPITDLYGGVIVP